MEFSKTLIKWYRQHKRELPWRHETDPYKIWLSEIILQQTQVVQGQSYYLKFIETFPTVNDLAAASEDKVLKLWQGLGYYSRARNLHAAAQYIVSAHHGKFPNTFEAIKQLKGVGPYTAAAIASIAFQLPHAVVDGNVYRVLSRIFGVETPIDSTQGKKEFQALADSLLNTSIPDIHNQALMEFGALHCRPVNPACDACVFNTSCFALKTRKVTHLPVKEKKIKSRERYLNYFVILDKNACVAVNRRNEKDIWQGLYEFNLIETPESTSLEGLLKLEVAQTLLGQSFRLAFSSEEYKHILSHQNLKAKFHVCQLNVSFARKKASIPLKNLHSLAFPRLIEKFLKDCKLEKLV